MLTALNDFNLNKHIYIFLFIINDEKFGAISQIILA